MEFPRAELPPMARAHQRLPKERVGDLEAEVRRTLAEAGLAKVVKPGQRVALTAGSRGVAEIARILSIVAQAVREAGGQPFIVPAMGSHGGATVEGQLEVLHGYGITEQALGIPILASMEAVELGKLACGATLYQDHHAVEADATIAVGRVKAHTSFRSDVESGLCKMVSIGLGKQQGAESIHAHNLAEGIKQGAELSAQRSNVVLGLAIVENAAHQVYRVKAARPTQFVETDRELLKVSNGLLPRIPFDALDVLVVGQMGKNISGTGMDPNVIGMWRRTGEPPSPPLYQRVVVLELTPETEGNALGVGLADFTTERLVQQIQPHKGYMNALTAGAPFVVKVPMALPNDRLAMEVALKSAGANGGARVVYIRNTLALEELLVSEALLPEARATGTLEIVAPPKPLPFDPAGNLAGV